LDEETSLNEVVKVILKCLKIPLIKALFKIVFFQNKFNLKTQPLKNITLCFSFFFTLLSFGQVTDSKSQNAIIAKYLTHCAEQHNYIIEMSEWQNCLDEGLK